MYGTEDVQVGMNTNSAPSLPSASTAANGPQECGQAYAGYSGACDNYPYGNANYQGYNYGYLQQGNPSHSQNTGAYENSGSPYQPFSSFQNTNSYTDSTPYQSTGTYYNAGVYQNPGAYQSASYGGHPTSWGENNYRSYNAYSGYPGYAPPELSSAVSRAAASNHPQYQQDYQQQWADYYASLQNRPQGTLEVSNAPGTEPDNSTIPETSTSASSPNSQPPPPGTQPAWELNEAAKSQAGRAATTDSSQGTWSSAMGSFQSDQYSQMQHCHFEHQPYLQPNLLEQSSQYQQAPDQPQPLLQQGQSVPNHVPANSFQSQVPQTTSLEASHRKIGKLQIPTNPRIAPTLGVAQIISTKVNCMDAPQSQKPAYIGVSGKASTAKPSSDDVADAMLQPGMFPPSLRAYVERALARCKDDAQKKACQDIMKEMITEASSDGSLFIKDWDTEPLFPLPGVPLATSAKEFVQSSNTVSSLMKFDRSPVRRLKTRWEPIVEEKPDEKQQHMQMLEVAKEGLWDRLKEGEASVSSMKWDKQEGIWNKAKTLLQQQLLNVNKSKKAVKRLRKDVAGNSNTEDNSSGDSEEEIVQGGGVYLGTLGSVETPEEKKRRQSRTKRFDKGKETNVSFKGFVKGKVGIGGSASARRATALLLSRSYGDGNGGAVEDINWDALTVKGTCQEVEKRYLRLTSAPDPSTVRPEEVLKKALDMVQTTQKNYLYKCEQLKSIRQDLTVQRIRDQLTAQVYETHARMALEAGDLAEYNQCQSQLKGLYAEGIKGCHHEFAAYNLLYIILQQGNNRDLLSSMARLSAEAKEDEAIKHALAVRAAVAAGNYTAFFRLYRTAPNLNTCLMDLYVERMRFEAVRCMSRSYRPTLAVSFIARMLGFTGLLSFETVGADKESEALEECEEWLRAHGAHLVIETSTGELHMDGKVSATSLFMPEPEDAVAHGDINLAINDFFAQA